MRKVTQLIKWAICDGKKMYTNVYFWVNYGVPLIIKWPNLVGAEEIWVEKWFNCILCSQRKFEGPVIGMYCTADTKAL